MSESDPYAALFRDFYRRHGVHLSEDLLERLQDELIDTFEGEIEDEWEDLAKGLKDASKDHEAVLLELRQKRRVYMKELRRLQIELARLQDWVAATGQKIVVLFEGRDAAGKGGVIKRITQRLNPRVVNVVALPKPNAEEQTQWYFQRYVRHLPSAGHMVLFDRSWYNRAGVERVMGFASPAQIEDFFRTVPEFEKMLVSSGISLVKYWFSVSDEEQEFRFQCRVYDPLKQWKLSPMDLESRKRWEQYTEAKEEMLMRTSIAEAPWHIVKSDDKKRARLNCIHHLLSLFDYYEVDRQEVTLPEREHHEGYQRHSLPPQMNVPEIY